MAIYFTTNDPEKLLKDFKKKIDSRKITTWSYDKDGDFTHTPDQWKNKAWLRPEIQTGKLAFFILGQKNSALSVSMYAIYHGRFIEAMLRHCDDLFSLANATASPKERDIVGSSDN